MKLKAIDPAFLTEEGVLSAFGDLYYTSSTPGNPGNSLTPLIQGTTTTFANDVRLYSDALCLTQIGGGSAADFSSLGIATNVDPNTVTTIYGKVVHTDGSAGTLCRLLVSYVHDSLDPAVTLTAPTDGSSVNASEFSAVTFAGACSENGRMVQVTGSASGSGMCSAGTFSFPLSLSGVPDGTLSFTATQADAAGNVGNSSAVTITKDSSFPSVAFSAPATNSYVTAGNVSSFGISGTCSEEGRAVVLSGAATGSVSCSSGTWTFSLDLSSLPQGALTLTVNQSDLAGNSAPAASRSFIKDSVVPVVAFSSPSAGSAINGANVSSFTLSGTCSESSRTVAIGGALTTSTTCSSGVWSITLDLTSVADGAVTFTADHSDAAGNPATQASRSFVKDASLPTVAITTPAGGSFIGAASVSSFSVSGACSENGRNVVLSGAASGTVSCSGGAWSAVLDFSAASEGAVTIYADHSDSSGNSAVQASRSFVKDTTLPTVAISTPTANSVINSGSVSTFAVTGSCSEETRNILISGDASSTVTCSSGAWTASLDFSSAVDGTVTINVNHSDAAGNSATQATRSFLKDTDAPTIAITAPAEGSYANAANSSGFVISGACSENTRNVVLSGAASATVTCSGGAWSASLDLTSAAQGTFTIYADHSDSNGNVAPQTSRSFVKDTVAPTLAISGPAANSSITAATVSSFSVSGSCSDTGSNVIITGDASATVSCLAGAWNANLDFTSASDGAVSIAVNHSDSAGNPATQASRSFIKDTGVPTVAITAPAVNSSINSGNAASFTVSGSCSEDTGNVVISGATSATVTCSSGVWSANLDFTAASQGSVTIYADHNDSAGNPAAQTSRSFTKDTVAPAVAITSPASGASVNSLNMASFTVSGTCSEDTRNVILSGGGSGTVACSSGVWTANLDLSAAADGAVTVYADHQDLAGNSSPQASRSFMKTSAPGGTDTLVINSGAAYTNTTSVTLTLHSDNYTSQMYVTNTAGCAGGGSWEAYSTSRAWTLGQTDGTATVHVQYRDAAGNLTSCISDTIIHDGVAPTVAITAPAANSYINAENVSSYTVTGTCSEDTRNVIISGDASATVACASGSWTGNLDFSGAAEGAVTINVNHSDAAGNAANQATRSFVKDVGSPVVAISTPAADSVIPASSVSSYTVTGTCSENTRSVVITGDASATVSCTSLTWSANLDFSSAAEGAVTINVNHSDAAGNAAAQASRSFEKDTGAPVVVISSPAANSYINSGTASSYTVNGTCSENTRNVVISGSASGTSVCTGGLWSVGLDFSGAGDGTVTVNVDHSDSAGNAAPQVSRSFVKDTVAPTLAISTPAANSYITSGNVGSFTITGSCSENTRSVAITGDASATVTCSSLAWTADLDFSSASEGTVTLNVNHSDAAGNSAAQVTRSFIKDVTAPTVVISTPAANSVINSANVAAFTVTGTCSENSRNVVVSGDASATVACSSGTWTSSLNFSSAPDGTVTIKVDHQDDAGNPAAQASRSFEKDATSPVVAVSSPAANSAIPSASVSSYAVSGTCSEDTRNVVISGSASATVTCSAGAWSANLDFSGAADGTVTIDVDHSDAAGNSAAQTSRSFIKDTIAPTLAISAPAANSYINAGDAGAYTVNGTCSENSRNVVISGSAAATVACTGGLWSVALDFSGAGDGTVTINVDHSDASGNAATQVSRNFIKDVGVPTLAISSPASGAFVNSSNVSSFVVSGTCSESTRSVVISGSASSTVTCSTGAWSANLDFSGAADGTVTIDVDHSDAAGNPATQVSRSFTKDTGPPTVAITSPAANSYINSGADSSFAVSGTCSEDGKNVVITGAASGSVTCSSNAWSINLDFSSAAQGAANIFADLADAAGNSATQVSRSFTKDTVAPTVTVNQASGQADPATTLPINFTIVFSEAISAGTFTTSDITQSGTASGITWSLSTSDNITFTLAATAVSTAGTLVPSLGASVIQDLAGNGNAASTSTDNSVGYNAPAAGLTWSFVDGTGANGINYDVTQTANVGNMVVFGTKIYAIWSEAVSGSVFQIRAKVYNGNDSAPGWTSVDGGGVYGINKNTAKAATTPMLAVFNSKLYATWIEDYRSGPTDYKNVRVAVYNGNDSAPGWTFVDGGGAAGLNYATNVGVVSSHLVAVGTKLYLVWYEGASIYQVRTRVFNGNDTTPVWSFVDGGASTGQNYNTGVSAVNLHAVSFNSKLFLAWRESNGTANQIRVKVYNANEGAPSWTWVDGGGATGLNKDVTKSASSSHLFVMGSKLYLSWLETNGTVNQVRVAVYNGNEAAPGWAMVDGNGVNGLNHDPTKAAFNQVLGTNGSTLYLFWRETNGSANQIRAKAYNGNDSSPSWSYVDGGGTDGLNKDPSKSGLLSTACGFNSKIYLGWSESPTSSQHTVAVGQ